jgi:hypothetical protein
MYSEDEKKILDKIELETNVQKKYNLYLKISECNEFNQEKYLLKAVDLCSERLDSYYLLLIKEYNKGNYRKGAGYGLMAPICRKIKEEYLDVNLEAYKNFDINLSVCCYYSGYYEEGYNAAVRGLEISKKYNYNIELAQNNIKYFSPYIETRIINFPIRQDLIVIDNFYDNVDEIRKIALEIEYPIKGNYPGQRSEKTYLVDKIKEKFESIIGRKITYWPTNNYNGSFQWVTETDKSWIHRDQTTWSAVIFLTPDAPVDGGTKLYKHKKTGKIYAETPEIEKLMNESSYKEDDWYLVDKIGNLYNRCILFRGKKSHISDRYFGTDINTGRLFQTFFFND